MQVLEKVVFAAKICRYIKCENLKTFVNIACINEAFNECVINYNILKLDAELLLNGITKGIDSSVLCFINSGIDINIENKDGDTALILAARHGKEKYIELLCNQSCININFQNKIDGDTALIMAAYVGEEKCMEILCKQINININAKNRCGDMALICAAYLGYIGCVELLCKQKNTDINAKSTYEKSTALIRAAKNGKKGCVEILCKQRGIDINAKNLYGYTALFFAEKNSHKECVEILKRYGAT